MHPVPGQRSLHDELGAAGFAVVAAGAVDEPVHILHVFLQYSSKRDLYCPLQPPNEAGFPQIVLGLTVHLLLPGQRSSHTGADVSLQCLPTIFTMSFAQTATCSLLHVDHLFTVGFIVINR